MTKKKVVMFSGGTGTKSITDYLLTREDVELTIVVNCYDDGKSTGRLRKYIPGMLGPSDIRKNIARVRNEPSLRALEERVERSTVAPYFQRYEATRPEPFDYTDCAVGNITFADLYLKHGQQFNIAVAAMNVLLKTRATVLNVTAGENLYLTALCQDGTILKTEAEISTGQHTSAIQHLALMSYEVTNDAWSWIAAGKQFPEINPVCKTALQTADLIVYGPGTQHSSLLPSYMTRGVAQVISENVTAQKVYISNIRRDADTRWDGTVNGLADKFLRCMSRGTRAYMWESLVTLSMLQKCRGDEYIPIMESRFPGAFIIDDWQSQSGIHDAEKIFARLEGLCDKGIVC